MSSDSVQIADREMAAHKHIWPIPSSTFTYVGRRISRLLPLPSNRNHSCSDLRNASLGSKQIELRSRIPSIQHINTNTQGIDMPSRFRGQGKHGRPHTDKQQVYHTKNHMISNAVGRAMVKSATHQDEATQAPGAPTPARPLQTGPSYSPCRLSCLH